jgi:hypothetical protein
MYTSKELFVYSHLNNFLAIKLLVIGLQNSTLAFISEDSCISHTCCDKGPRFIWSHPRDRHPLPTVAFEPTT